MIIVPMEWKLGMPLAIFCGGILCSMFRSKPWMPWVENENVFGAVAMGAGVVGFLLTCMMTIPLFFLPAGVEIRPMGWALSMSAAVFGTIFFTLCFGITAMLQERPARLGGICILLGVAAWLVPGPLVVIAKWIVGFEFSD